MTAEAIHATVRRILSEQLGVDESEVTPTAHIEDDLGADSLDTVEILMELEERFNINVPDKDAATLSTVQNIVTYLEAVVPPTAP